MKKVPDDIDDILKKYGLTKRDKQWIKLFLAKWKLAKLFGGQCKRCGETDLRCLCFHHKLGGMGSDKWRHMSRKQRQDHILAIAEAGRPEDIELLCMNCHTKEFNNPKLQGRVNDLYSEFELRKMMVRKRVTPTELPDGLKLID